MASDSMVCPIEGLLYQRTSLPWPDMDRDALCSLARLEGRLAPRPHRIRKRRKKRWALPRINWEDGHAIVTCVPKIDRNVTPVLHADSNLIGPRGHAERFWHIAGCQNSVSVCGWPCYPGGEVFLHGSASPKDMGGEKRPLIGGSPSLVD